MTWTPALSALALLLAACAGPPSASTDGPADAAVSDAAADAAPATLRLASSDFQDGGTLPIEYTCDGVKNSPPLTWTGAPPATAEFELLMTTVAPDGLKWNWVVHGIPRTAAAFAKNSIAGGTAGLTSDGPLLAYSPPCSQGPGPKTYTFTLYAVSKAPTLPSQPNQVTGAVLTSAMTNLILAQSALSVTDTR